MEALTRDSSDCADEIAMIVNGDSDGYVIFNETVVWGKWCWETEDVVVGDLQVKVVRKNCCSFMGKSTRFF